MRWTGNSYDCDSVQRHRRYDSADIYVERGTTYRGGNTTARASSERKHCAHCRNFASRPVSFIDHRPTQFVSIDTNLLSKLGHSVYLLLPSLSLSFFHSLDLLPLFPSVKISLSQEDGTRVKHPGMLETEPPHNTQ